MNLRISDFCHFVDGQNNLVAMYNALTLGMVIADNETASVFRNARHKIVTADEVETLRSNGGEQLMEQLLKHKLVVPLNERTDLQDYEKIQSGLDCKAIGILYLLTTDACNLACRYCFVENAVPDGYKFTMMSEDTARSGVDLFARTLQKSHTVEEPQIIFYGGEPLTNFAVIEKTLTYVAQCKSDGTLPRNTSITINTNGTLINEHTVSVLKNVENLNIAISVDGWKEIHDRCRPYHHKGGSYDDIMRGYRLLADNGIEAGFCCTISRYNVDKLDEIARWFAEEMHAKSLGFNIMIENLGPQDIRGNALEYAQKTTLQIIKCFRYFRERGVYEDRIMRKVNAFADGKVYYYDCGGCGQQLVVSPSGMVGVCQGYCVTKKYFIHPDTTFNPLEHPIWEQWRYRSPLFMPQCRECIALSVCGGGCPYSADMRNGSIWELDNIFCVHAKATVEFLICDLIGQMTQ